MRRARPRRRLPDRVTLATNLRQRTVKLLWFGAALLVAAIIVTAAIQAAVA